MARRTLSFISEYPTPQKLYNIIVSAKGYDYKNDKVFFQTRDRALVALTYLIAARISEILRLKKSQFNFTKAAIIVTAIKLSKSTKAGKPRKHLFRQEAFLPLFNERAPLTQLVTEYLTLLEPDQQLFPFSRQRAFQIVTGITGEPIHWLRAYGENYLYDNWEHDLLAVADYLKIDAPTLQEYIRKSYKKYKPA